MKLTAGWSWLPLDVVVISQLKCLERKKKSHDSKVVGRREQDSQLRVLAAALLSRE